VGLSYNVQTNFPFTYRGDLPTGFKDVLLAYTTLRTTLDFRNDPIRPHKGFFFTNDLQVAGNASALVPSNVLFPIDVRVQPEARAYIPLTRKVTLAMRATTGFLLPSSYGKTFEQLGPPGPDGIQRPEPPSADDTQLVFFRGFFSGGPSSNRGYAYRGVGPKQPVAFFAPGVSTTVLTECRDDPNLKTCRDALATWCAMPEQAGVPACAYPTGGLSLWEASVEVRFPMIGDLGGAVFCDASDVSRFRLNIRLLYPHLSCGFGLHYDTPVGPIRLDAGFQIPGLQVLDKTADPTEQSSDSFYAISIGVGEAF
jgi:outer membrane protein insertion porin family/translocation and assembly module TamA